MALKLSKPPPDDGTRAEFDAFLLGTALVLISIKRAFPSFDFTDIYNSAIKAATELYPPFDPLTEPVKCRGDGLRADGIEMSED
jgi:hypothetical protein